MNTDNYYVTFMNILITDFIQMLIPSVFVGNITAIALTLTSVSVMTNMAERIQHMDKFTGEEHKEPLFNSHFRTPFYSFGAILMFMVSEAMLLSPLLPYVFTSGEDISLVADVSPRVILFSLGFFVLGIFMLFVSVSSLIIIGVQKDPEVKKTWKFFCKLRK